MKTFEFLTQYLNSPIVAHRNKALLCLFKNAMVDQKVIESLGLNLASRNFDIVLNSLHVLHAVGLKDGGMLKPTKKIIAKLGKQTNHFAIALISRDILTIMGTTALKDADSITKKITPKIRLSVDSEMFFDNCDYSLEYSLGAKQYKYELSDICKAFRYDCRKATKKVFAYMGILGYKKGIQYWKDRPSRWQSDYEDKLYETRLDYYARHAIQIFLMWCVDNLVTTDKDWSELLIDERKWDASIPQLIIQERPSFLHFSDLKIETDEWIKKRINKGEAYELFDLKKEWIPLYENSNFNYEDKSFDRYATTCFVCPPVSTLSKKIAFSPPHYNCHRCYINELPIKAMLDGNLYLDDSNNYNDKLKGKLLPAYGIVSEDFDDYIKLFPAPEIIEHFKLTQRKNSLSYYKSRELVIYCVNWQDGYYRKLGRQGADRFDMANYGHLLMIKTKYIKKYLEDRNLRLMVVGRISKRKVDKWTREGSYTNKKTSKNKWLSFEIIKSK